MSKGFLSRYSLTSDRARSKETGNEGVIIAGWSLGLPDQAHKLVLSNSKSELLKQKKFFLPYERHIASDKLLADLSLSKSIGVIPVYLDFLPVSEKVSMITSITARFPILSSDKALQLKKQLRYIKQKLSELLLATKETVLIILNNLKIEIDDLNDQCLKEESIQVQIYCLEFRNELNKELYFAFVIEKSNDSAE
jgi:ABC-type uncharacterized transport system permease subunit